MLGSGAVLSVLEDAMRAALASAGAALLQAVLDQQDDGYAGPHAECVSCAGQAGYAGSRPKTITTVLGPTTLQRAWYHCAACRRGFAPRDRQLGLLPGGALSPGLAEMTALAGAEVSFARAAGLLAGLAGITLSPKTTERSAEASGATAGGCRAGGRRDPRAQDRAAAAARARPRHAVCRGGRHRRAGARQRDRRTGRQRTGRQGRHPRGQARPVLHRLQAGRRRKAVSGSKSQLRL